MTRFILAAGVAALAITAPVGAKPGGGGHGGGNGEQAASAQQHGGGGSKAAKVQRSGSFKSASAKGERRGGGQRFASFDRGGKGHAQKFERRANKVAKFDRGNRFNTQFGDRVATRGLINGDCPPGLWKKTPSCVPPGQAKKLGLLGREIPFAYRNGIVPLALQNLYGDTPDYYYRYGDGNMYRVNRSNNLIESLLPLLGGGYSAGQMFPTSYMNSYVPNYYQSFYPDTADNYYRYANGNVYGIDPYSGLIDNVIPMYANGYGYGQMLPASYSAYNVPYQYRSMYYDTADSYYRYAPGAIYQVDPSTSLITSVASLLTGNGLSVGQQLPMGYSAYNMPLAYRDQYYDTPDAWYRYNNGNIYQVDPTSQVVTSLIRALA